MRAIGALAPAEAAWTLRTQSCVEQLQRILDSAEMAGSIRDRKFLSYVVEETLAGRGDRIKAFSIAVEVFGRNASFDPQNDPIVRVQAGHLRRALEHYYQGAGRADPIVITIPKGGYVPDFTVREASAADEPAEPPFAPVDTTAAPGRKRQWAALATVFAAALALGLCAPRLWSQAFTDAHSAGPDIPRLLVRPIDDLGGVQSSAAIARGVTQEIVGQIAKFKDIIVVESAGPDSQPAASSAGDATALARYALAASIDFSDDSFRVQARLSDQPDGAILWASTYYGDLKGARLYQSEAEMAGKLATALAQPYGVIFRAETSRRVENPPDGRQAYSCTLLYYTLHASFDPTKHARVRTCLEQAVAQFPSYATAWALLSRTYIDELRFHLPIDPSSPPATVDQARAAARRAIELDPQNVRGLLAQMSYLEFDSDNAGALKLGEQALATYPNDTELMGEYGIDLASSGDWDHGCTLVEQARAQSSRTGYESWLALCAYMRGDYEQASMWIRTNPARASPNDHVIAAAVFAEAGASVEAEAERVWLIRNAPDLVANLNDEAALPIYRERDVDRLIGSLKKAGLPVSEHPFHRISATP